MSAFFAQSLLAEVVSTTAPAASPSPVPTLLFFVFALMTVAAAFTVALARNIVRAAVGLLFALTGVSGLYFLLHAEFLAATQLVVYVGGTLILIVFGVMLTSKNPNVHYEPRRWEVLWGVVVGIVLGVPMLWLVLSTRWHALAEVPAGPATYSVSDLGKALLDPAGYLVPFELVSMLLLAVMIGAAYLAKSRKVAAASGSATPPAEPSVLKNTRAPDGSDAVAAEEVH